jgi:hypothetical protein
MEELPLERPVTTSQVPSVGEIDHRRFDSLFQYRLSYFRLVDSALDISRRDGRESELKELIDDGNEELKWLTLGHHRKWAAPELDFKVRLDGGMKLLSLGEYFAEGLLPLTFDQGSDQYWLDLSEDEF